MTDGSTYRSREDKTKDVEENRQGIQLVKVYGGLEGVIPDIFSDGVSEVGPVREKVHIGIEPA